MAAIDLEWAYFLNAHRLCQSLSRNSSAQAAALLRDANKIASDNKRALPRALGLLSFVILNRWLSNWIDVDEAQAVLRDAVEDLGIVARMGQDAGEELAALERLNTGRAAVDESIRATILSYASLALKLDPSDNDNHWSSATAKLYNQDFAGAFTAYQQAAGVARTQQAPNVDKGSLQVDYADALFFAGSGADVVSNAEHAEAIRQAIKITETAISDNGNDPKRHRWNWTLGWAYYELAYYENSQQNIATSLALLQMLRSPHHLIQKNLMASYVQFGQLEAARRLASEFRKNNPGYTLAVEDRWPYRNPGQLERWKKDLEMAGLPR